MSVVVGVHGVGHQYGGEDSLKASWLPAVRDGLRRADGEALAEALGEADLQCAFFGDLFRPAGKSALDPPLTADQITERWEEDLLAAWHSEAARVDAGVPAPDAQTKIRAPSSVQRALDALSQSAFFAGLAEKALILDLKQVRRYLRDHEVRRLAQERLGLAIRTDTRIVIAHSLGSIVAYEALCRHPEWPVTDLLTIGSPLGIRNLIFDSLEPAPKNGLGVWPEGVKRWTNIADGGDVVALVKKLAPRFGSDIVDRLTTNGASAHDAIRYLTTREAGHAVAAAI